MCVKKTVETVTGLFAYYFSEQFYFRVGQNDDSCESQIQREFS